MKQSFFLICALFLVLASFAQTQQPAADHPNLSQNSQPDSLKKKGLTTNGTKRSKHKKLILAPDTLTMSDYMISIERVNDHLNSIQDSVRLGFEMVGMGRAVREIASEVKLIRQNVRNKQSSLNIRSLYLYQNFASKMDEDNEEIRTKLGKTFKRVYHAKLKLKNLLTDSIFHHLYTDSTLRNAFDEKIDRIERKWTKADSTTRANIDSLNILKMIAADNSINLSNMLNAMDTRLDKARMQLLKPDAAYLWSGSSSSPTVASSTLKAVSVLASEQKVIAYYFRQTIGERVLIFVFAIFLAVWLLMKRKIVRLIRHKDETFAYLNIHYLTHYPILSLLVVLVSLVPFFDVYAPTSYLTIEYLLILVAASFIFYKTADRKFLNQWFILVLLYVADTLTYLLIQPSLPARLWLLALHLAIVYFLVRLYRQQDKEMHYYKWIRAAISVGIALSSLGLICNILGRFSLSGLFGIAGIFGVLHAITLPVFIDTIIEVVLLQLASSRLRRGHKHAFDTAAVISKLKLPLLLVSLGLWFVMLSSNLNLYHFISDSLLDMLSAKRSIGSITFQMNSVLLFFFIIWIAHILQRNIGFWFGDTGVDGEESGTFSKGQHSRLLIIRLLVLIGGYLLAIAASGLPIDKLTFLLGALGVGIGMGLQNIVNNFVSGIILIFDGSLQIGDEIEINGQAGKVKGIGLRASTLSTADGADVIIPNGNILSQNIVNWTFSNDQKRVTLEFWVIGKELDANVVNGLINETIKKIPHVITKRNPVILYMKVNQDACHLVVKFWCNIHQTDLVKSEAMQKLNAAFNSKGIGFE